MSAYSRIQKAFSAAEVLPFDKNSKIVVISDCHRGIGSGADDFAKNQNLYYVALNHYLQKGFTYIELGDGDELWKNRRFAIIAREYQHIFALLAQFHQSGRLHMLYGNHDMDKKNPAWVARNLESSLEEAEPLFPGIKIHEGLILCHRPSEQKILLLHGHQADFFNFRLWRLAKFLVRYIWQPLELFGVQNPLDTPRSPNRRDIVERHLMDWCLRENIMLVAGHTHRTSFPKKGEPPYYNDGSCVHRRLITCLEIENDRISLIKWSVQPRHDNVLYVRRDVVESGTVLSKKQKFPIDKNIIQ